MVDLASHSTRSDVGARCSVLERSSTLPAAVTRAPASSSAAVIVVVVGSIEDGDKGDGSGGHGSGFVGVVAVSSQ